MRITSLILAIDELMKLFNRSRTNPRETKYVAPNGARATPLIDLWMTESMEKTKSLNPNCVPRSKLTQNDTRNKVTTVLIWVIMTPYAHVEGRVGACHYYINTHLQWS